MEATHQQIKIQRQQELIDRLEDAIADMHQSRGETANSTAYCQTDRWPQGEQRGMRASDVAEIDSDLRGLYDERADLCRRLKQIKEE